MLYNAKNVQFDTEKIQKQIYESYGMYQKTEELAASGNLGFPVKVIIPMTEVFIPKVEEATTDFKSKLAGLTGRATTPSVPSIFVMGKTYSVTVSCGVYNHVAGLHRDKIMCIDLANPCISQIWGDIKVPRYISRVISIASEIKDKYFGEEWIIKLKSHSDMKDIISNEELFEKLEDGLTEARDMLSEGRIYTPVVKYVALEDVLALNLIKIVDKGTDKEENLFTGRCSAIVAEALVNGKYKVFGGIQLLKGITNPSIVPSIEVEKGSLQDNSNWRDQMIKARKVDIINTDAVKHMMCTRYIIRHFSGIDTLNSLKASIEAEEEETRLFLEKRANMTEEELEEEEVRAKENIEATEALVAGSKEEAEYIQNQIKSQRGYMLTGHLYGMECYDDRDKVLDILIPLNMDLSNSFKAKYI